MSDISWKKYIIQLSDRSDLIGGSSSSPDSLQIPLAASRAIEESVKRK